MDIRERVVRNNFGSWLKKDVDSFSACFAEEATYSECYGPEYHGVAQLRRWFEEWNQYGAVLQWDIKQFIGVEDTVVAEWYFRCIYDGNCDGFDGVSIIVFNKENQITSVKEFQSKAEHYFPYSS